MDLFVIQIAIVFVPGLIWARIDALYGKRTRQSQSEFLIATLIYGLFTYAMTYVLYGIFSVDFSPTSLGKTSPDSVFVDTFLDEILVSIGVAIPLATLWLYVSNKKFLARVLQKIRATKSYGDEDVWSYTFNSEDESTSYIHFRDFEHSLVYAGWVDSFSPSDQLRELLLRDVRVHDLESAEVLYETPYLYVARQKDHVTIEFPYDPKAERANHEQRPEQG